VPRFPSEAWAHALREILNSSAAFREAAKDLEADFLLHVEAEPPRLPKDQAIYVRLQDGRCTELEEVEPDGGRSAEFTIIGSYPTWVALLKDELDPVQGVLTRRFVVKGSMARLMRHVGAARELLRATRAVETEFA
jgi:putative sterol carrier protein